MWLTPPEDGDIRYARRHPSGPVVVYERAGPLDAGGGRAPMRRRRRPGAARAAAPCWTAGAEIVRYHPHLRCTVGPATATARCWPTTRARRCWRRRRELWAHRDELDFAVAEPLEYDAATRTVWLGAVRGEPVEPTPELARRMGAALATLARSGVVPPGGEGGGRGAAARRAGARRRRQAARPRRARGVRATSPRRSSRPSPTCAARSRRCSRASPRSTPRRPTCRCGRPTARRTRRRGCSTASGSGWSTSTGSRSGIPNATSPPSQAGAPELRRRVRARLRRAGRDPARGLSPRARAREGAARDL